MTDQNEKIALIKAGISGRYADYLTVKSMREKTLHEIMTETTLTKHFITKARKIAGLSRRKTG